MSSPLVRIAAVPHSDRPTDVGHSPSWSSRYRSSRESASICPVSHASRDGIARGSIE
jgi:hypothetical protein